MAHTCSECCYLKIDGETNYGKYWCDKKFEWHYADEQECYRYCTAYSRDSSVAKSAREYSKDSQKSSGCFITTALCQILSMADDNEYLTSLRNFREGYLQKNKKGLEILVQYDIVGRQISERLKNDSGKFNFAYILLENYIKPVVSDIQNNKYEEAIDKYTEMTEKLIKFYHIDNTINIDINDVEPKLSGHGRLCLKNSH